jgi:hypothetical protein
MMGRKELSKRAGTIVDMYRLREQQRGDWRGLRPRKAKQTAAATRKLSKLLSGPDADEFCFLQSVVNRTLGLDDLDRLEDVRGHLQWLASMMELAADAKVTKNTRVDEPMQRLVADLANLYVEVTGEPFTHPDYDDIEQTISGPFVDFFRLAMAGLTDISDEHLRNRIRDAVDGGQVVHFSARPVLCQRPSNHITGSTTNTFEVVNVDIPESPRRTRRGNIRGREHSR